MASNSKHVVPVKKKDDGTSQIFSKWPEIFYRIVKLKNPALSQLTEGELTSVHIYSDSFQSFSTTLQIQFNHIVKKHKSKKIVSP